jgi:uncharacterized membrane protein
MDFIFLIIAAGFGFLTLRRQWRRVETRLGKIEEQHTSLSRAFDDLHAAYYGRARQVPDEPLALPAPPEETKPVGSAEDTTAGPPETEAQGAEVPPPPSVPSVPAPGEPAPDPQPAGVGLEERLGTRWAVWVGGFALALGGVLMVRYSIEQGIFGPGVRVALGALLALALVTAGEWFRRSEAGLGIDTIPQAHIPGVLTAAGTVTAFGTIYAAHAL